MMMMMTIANTKNDGGREPNNVLPQQSNDEDDDDDDEKLDPVEVLLRPIWSASNATSHLQALQQVGDDLMTMAVHHYHHASSSSSPPQPSTSHNEIKNVTTTTTTIEGESSNDDQSIHHTTTLLNNNGPCPGDLGKGPDSIDPATNGATTTKMMIMKKKNTSWLLYSQQKRLILMLLHTVVTTGNQAESALQRAVFMACTNLSTLLQACLESLQWLSSSSSSSSSSSPSLAMATASTRRRRQLSNDGNRTTHPLTTVSPTALSNTLAILGQLLFCQENQHGTHCSDNKVHRNDDPNSEFCSHPLYLEHAQYQGFASAMFVPFQQEQQQSLNERLLDGHDRNENNDFFPDDETTRIQPKEWVERLLRVPRWISNAYFLMSSSSSSTKGPFHHHHQHHRGVPLYWTEPRYLQRLVQQATWDVLLLHQHNHGRNEHGEESTATTTTAVARDLGSGLELCQAKEPNSCWWITLLCVILQQQQQQGANVVVQGFSNLRQELHEEAEHEDHEQQQSESTFYVGAWKGAMSLLSCHLSPRELALICRSLLWLWLSITLPRDPQQQQQQTQHETLKMTTTTTKKKKKTIALLLLLEQEWIENLVQTILSSSRQVQESVVHTCLLTHSQQQQLKPSAGASTVPAQSSSTADSTGRSSSWMGPILAKILDRIQEEEETHSSFNDSTNLDDEDDDNTPLSISPLLREMNKVALVWGSTVFVRQTDPFLQSHVTSFLNQGLELVGFEQLDPDKHNELVSSLLQGTSTRLESSIVTIRLDGMQIGQALAWCLGKELKFDELEQYHHNEETRRMEKEATSTPPKSLSGGDGAKARRAQRRWCRPMPALGTSGKELDPDAEYVSDEEDDDDDDDDDDSSNSKEHSSHVNDDSSDDDNSIWDGDDEPHLQPYSLDDDEEDLRETPRPLYLRDALELLRTPETDVRACSAHETAMQELPSLIRRQSYDLPDVAVDLAVQMLHQENKYDMANFGDHKQASLVALLVTEPLSVGLALITDVFGSCSLLTRLHILSALEEGAFELAGFKQLQQERLEQSHIEQQQPPLTKEGRVHGKRQLVGGAAADLDTALTLTRSSESINKGTSSEEERLLTRQRTRRWGRGRTRPIINKNNNSFRNRFASVAPHWFYALLGNFVQRRDGGNADNWPWLLPHTFNRF